MKLLLAGLLIFSLSALQGNDLRSENARLKRELELRQKELDRLTARLTDRENELRRLRVWMGTVSADGRMTAVSEREQRLLHALKILADSSGDMVLKTMEFAELLRPRLNALPLASADRVRLVMALEELERSAARVNSIADAAEKKGEKNLENVRITAVRPDLNMVVIAAGALRGIFPGMVFVTRDGKVALRVIETRPMISGAVPVAGDIRRLVPGGTVRLDITRRAAKERQSR